MLAYSAKKEKNKNNSMILRMRWMQFTLSLHGWMRNFHAIPTAKCKTGNISLLTSMLFIGMSGGRQLRCGANHLSLLETNLKLVRLVGETAQMYSCMKQVVLWNRIRTKRIPM